MISASEVSSTVTEDRVRPWWPAVGLHLGLLTVCGGCVYTVHPEGWFSARQWIAYGFIGVLLLAAAAFTRGRAAATQGGRMLLALGAATALYLAYDPPLADLPGLSALTVGYLGRFNPGLATLGVALLLLTWVLTMVVEPRCDAQVRGLRIAVLVALGIVLGIALIMQLALGQLYNLTGTTGNLELAFRVLQAAIVMLAALEMSGTAGVGAVAHCYVGLALLAAVARNLLIS